jgi:two-component SAPR family response regulator
MPRQQIQDLQPDGMGQDLKVIAQARRVRRIHPRIQIILTAPHAEFTLLNLNGF